MRHRLVLGTDSLDPSGLGEHMLTLGRALQPQFEVIVAAPALNGGEALLSRAAQAGLGVKALDLEDLAAFSDWLGRADIALLHVHAGIGWEGLALGRAGLAAGVPVVRTEHLPFVLTDAEQIAAYAEAIRDVDGVILVSDASAAAYAAAGHSGAKFATIRNGIAPHAATRTRAEIRSALGIADDQPFVLTVARFTPQKGHATLVAAIPMVLQSRPDAQFVLVGTGPELVAIQEAVDSLGIDGSVQFLGQRNDVADLLAASDLFVLPSEFEGLPLVLLEAMAAGIPIVATAIGGSEEAVGPAHPYLAPVGEPIALGQFIVEALSETLAARASAQQAFARFQTQFRASRMAAETAAVYAPLLPHPEDQRVRSMDKTRIGFIGVGGIANRHLGVLETFDDIALVAFADLDIGRAEDAARRFGARAFSDFQAMLDSVDLDAIFICIPPFAHGAAERAVMAAGLPFFVEKPISLDLDTAEAIARDVAASGLVTGVGYHWRYLDTVDEAKRILADRPAQLISGYWLDQTPPPQWWWKADRSGGQMIEQTTHIIDLARYLVGDVDLVFGLAGHSTRDAFPGLDVPTVSTASLKFSSGAIGNIGSTCLLKWGHRVGLHVFGDGIAVEMTDHDLMVDVGAGRPYRHAEGDPVWREDRDFVDAVRGGENRIRVPYAEALATHRVALAISRSAQTGQPVSLQDAA